MLIRSQDKQTLVNFDKIDFISVLETKVVVSIQGYSRLKILGKYSTKEKALKILEMIESAYEYIMTEKESYTIVIPQEEDIR